jgi:hypothetical protein
MTLTAAVKAAPTCGQRAEWTRAASAATWTRASDTLPAALRRPQGGAGVLRKLAWPQPGAQAVRMAADRSSGAPAAREYNGSILNADSE